VEPKLGGDRYDLTSLRGRLAGNDRPDPIDVERELRRAVEPRITRMAVAAPPTKRSRRPAREKNAVRIPEAKPARRSRGGHGRRSPGRRAASRRRIAMVLVGAAALSLVAAYAQVRVHRQVTAGTVVLAVDVSHSMAATDVAPDRLAAAVDAARAFLGRLPTGFRVGLVTFASQPHELVPPTSDRERLLAALSSLATPSEKGTVIGDGLSAAVSAVRDDRAANGDRPAAIVLLTDGQDSGSATAPESAAADAASSRIPVYTVAISGTSSSLDQTSGDLLRRIALTTRARAFTSTTAGQLTQVYATLGSRLSYELAIGSHAGPFVIVAVLLTLAAAALVLIGQRDPYDGLAAPRRRR
jgi:Ca-activated chloride channel homolog